MAFGLGCFSCCQECDPCDAVCDETPDANFGTVYQADDTDGFLQWAGDAVPINGPFTPPLFDPGTLYQEITLADGASIAMPGNRFPCYMRFRAWRSIPGGEGSEAVTAELHLTCGSGRVRFGSIVLNAGESITIRNAPWSAGQTATYYFETSSPPIPLVAGDYDQSSNPPAA